MLVSFHVAQVRNRHLAPVGRGYWKTVTSAHRVKKERQATAAIGGLAEGAIDLARGDERIGVGGAHPVHRGSDLVIGDVRAMADDHAPTLGDPLRPDPAASYF
jgi:hypothetical protein